MAKDYPDLLVFDYETMSNNALNAAVVSLGAVICNWEDIDVDDALDTVERLEKDGFYCNIKLQGQYEKYGLECNPETIRWWSKQGDFAKEMLQSKDKVTVEQHCQMFIDFCISKGLTQKTAVYIRAPHFDFTIMQNVFERVGFPLPFNHFKVRDVRTAIDIVYGTDNGYVPGFREELPRLGLTEHYALHDCLKDLLQLRLCRE